MAKLKAYVVKDSYDDDCPSSLVFAETGQRARVCVLGTDNFADSEYINLRARREPEADKWATDEEGETLDFCENADKFKELGWFCFEPSYCERADCVMKKEDD